jgi:Na+-driven multidrug efflux pump
LSGLPPALAELGSQALLFALPMPGLVVLHSWFQGTLVNRRATRGVTEAVALALVASAAVLVYGVATQPTAGLLIVWLGFDLGALVQVLWLWHRSRGSMQAMRQEEDGLAAVVPYDPVGA